MASNGGAGQRRRHSTYEDLTFAGICAEKPALILSVADDVEVYLDGLRRDRTTTRVMRSLLAGKWATDSLLRQLNQYAVQGRTPNLVLTLLARAQRERRLPDGDWWLLTLVGEHVDGNGTPHERGIGWTRIRLPAKNDDADVLIVDVDFYSLPDGALAVQNELVLVAHETGWQPHTAGPERAVVVLGPEVTSALDGKSKEIQAWAAVAGAHVTVLEVPRDSSTSGWKDTRDRALIAEGPVYSLLAPHETSGHRVLDAIRGQAKSRQLTELVPGDVPHWFLPTGEMLSNMGFWSIDSPQRELLNVDDELDGKPRWEEREVHLVKNRARSGPKFDVMAEIGCCSHKTKKQRLTHRSAPKKYKGVVRYLEKLSPPGQLIKAEMCPHSGCFQVRVRYETQVTDDLVAEEAEEGEHVKGMERGPPNELFVVPSLS